MVKVLPTTFTLFESQNIFNAPGEPLCAHCSEQYVFIACEGCVIEAHDLFTEEKVSRLRTISPVSELVYNPHGDCIVSLERRNAESPAAARIYFRWRRIRELERPMRVVSLGSPRQIRHAQTTASAGTVQDVEAEILELPVENVSCLAVCELTGTIAVGSEKNIRLFTLRKDPTASLSTGGFKIVTYMDIRTDMKLKKICICGHYIACISTHRVRVMKILILGSDDHPWSRFQLDSFAHPPATPRSSVAASNSCPDDDHFLVWSPSYVWETEAKRGGGQVVPKPEQSFVSRTPQAPVLPFPLSERESGDNTTEEDSGLESRPSTSADRRTRPHNRRDSLPTIGTITLPAIANSTSSGKRDTAKHELEVLGPAEYVWGQPLTVVLHREAGESTKCWMLTMLYKRLASSGFAYVHASSNETRERAATSVDDMSKRRSYGGGDMNKMKTKGGIHTVQLVPTFSSGGSSCGKMVGMSCIFANRAHGYIYDVFTKTKLVTSLAFMTRCQTASYDGQFLHSLSTESETLDSYTCRVGASVLSSRPFVTGYVGGDETRWMEQPCPPPFLELTLISSKKFLGCVSLTSSSNFVVVFCKETLSDALSPVDVQQSFLSSLSLRRPKPVCSVAWNIYVLRKKSVTDMFQQFCESAETLGEGSPPVLQHHLSEAHLLLRSLVIQGDSDGGLTKRLCQNCFELADSFCRHSVDKTALRNAAGYFVLSGKPISDVLCHVRKNYVESPTTTPFNVLVKYLNLVLFDSRNKLGHAEKLLPLANEILELYAKYGSDHLGDFILHSWLKGYSEERALQVCELLLSSSSPQKQDKTKHVIAMAVLYILCQLNRIEKASQNLSKIPESFVLSWAKEHPQFLLNTSDSRLTALGQVIMNDQEECFLLFLSHLLETKLVTIDTLSKALRASEEITPLGSQLLKRLLEAILTNKTSTTDSVKRAALLLADILFYRIITDNSSKSTTFVRFTDRYVWLNKLPPFERSVGETCDSVLYTSPSSQSNLQDLMELQSLLCSQNMSREIAEFLDHKLESEAVDSDNKAVLISLQLLVWPHLDKLKEATTLILSTYPMITVEYCQCFYGTKLGLWKDLLSELSTLILTADETYNQKEITAVYKDILFHVVTLTSPEEFFGLLPPNGNILFFLPTIERSCKLYLAGQISGHLHNALKDI